MAGIAPRAVLTERARAEACRRVGKDAHAVAAVARDVGVSWGTVMRAVRDHSRSLVEDPDRLDGVAALDLDETSFLRARTAPTRWITGLVALEGGPLLDVVADRTRATVDGWLGVRPDSWPDHIAMVALDPWRGYASALTAPLGHARVVVTTSVRPAGQHGGRAAHRSGTSAAAGWARRAVREQSRPRPARRRRGCVGCRSAVAALRVGSNDA